MPVGVGEPQSRSGAGGSLHRISRVPAGQSLMATNEVASPDSGAVADAVVGVDRRMRAVGDVEDLHRRLHTGVDAVTNGLLPRRGRPLLVVGVVNGGASVTSRTRLAPAAI